MILDFADLPHIRATMDARKKRMQIWLEMPLSLPEYRNDEPSRGVLFVQWKKYSVPLTLSEAPLVSKHALDLSSCR